MRATRKLISAVAVAAIVTAAAAAYFVLQRRAGEWRVEVVVGDCRRVFSLHELEKLSGDVEVRDAGRLRCLPLAELVKECGLHLNATLVHRLVAVGADGYSRGIEEAYLHLPRTYLCLASEAEPEWGPVRLVAENLSRKYWVKHLVKVDVQAGPWVLSVRVDGETRRVFDLEELKSVAMNVEGLGRAVLVADILQAIGLSIQDVELLEFVGADGYRSVFHGSNATKAYVLLIDPNDWGRHGPLRSAVLGAPRGTWVRYLVAIEVVTKG